MLSSYTIIYRETEVVMVDNVKFNKVNPYQKITTTTTKTHTVGEETATPETSPIEAIVKSMVADPAPPQDVNKINELKLALNKQQYNISYDDIAEEILVEYTKR